MSGRFGQYFETSQRPIPRKRQVDCPSAPQPFIGPLVRIGVAVWYIRKLVYLQRRSLAVPQRNRLTFLRKMIIETICSAFGENLSTRFACVLIAITGIVELWTAFEELEDERVGFSAHFESI